MYAQDVFRHHHQNPHHNYNNYNYKMFKVDSVFHPDAIRLYPINLVNQTYQPWLGPMFLRSMEALVKPSSCKWMSCNDYMEPNSVAMDICRLVLKGKKTDWNHFLFSLSFFNRSWLKNNKILLIITWSFIGMQYFTGNILWSTKDKKFLSCWTFIIGLTQNIIPQNFTKVDMHTFF